MKILLLAPFPPPIGGIATWTHNFLMYVNVLEKKEEIYYHQNTAPKISNITFNSKIVQVLAGLLNSFIVCFGYIRNLNSVKPDVVYVTSSANMALLKDIFIVYLAKKKKIPIVIHWHFGRIPAIFEKRGWEYKLLLKVIRYCSHSILIDKHSFETLTRNGINNASFIPNPISLELEKLCLYIDKAKIKKTIDIIFVGHVIKTKGVFELVEACSLLSNVKIVLVGAYEIGIRHELELLASKKGILNFLEFTGPLPYNETLNMILKSKILVLPSYFEGFPYVILEGMALTCAIVATPVGAISEMVDSESPDACGICVPIKNSETLANSLSLLLGNESLRIQLGDKGKSKVLAHYTFSKIYQKYQEILHKSISNRNERI